MAENFYLRCLLVLLLLPLLVRWRWGLVATLVVTVIEVALVGLVFYLMAVYHLLPEVSVGEPSPQEHLFLKMRRGQAAGAVQLIFLGFVPAVAALIGGGLAVVWSVVQAVWHFIAHRA